jgi:hypothetical protein
LDWKTALGLAHTQWVLPCRRNGARTAVVRLSLGEVFNSFDLTIKEKPGPNNATLASEGKEFTDTTCEAEFNIG